MKEEVGMKDGWVYGDRGEVYEREVFFFKRRTAYEISACLVGSEMCIKDNSFSSVFKPSV